MFKNLETLADDIEQSKRSVLNRLQSCVMYLQEILLDEEVSLFDKAEIAGQIRAYLHVLGSSPDLQWYAVKMICGGEEVTKEQEGIAMKALNKMVVKIDQRLES